MDWVVRRGKVEIDHFLVSAPNLGDHHTFNTDNIP